MRPFVVASFIAIIASLLVSITLGMLLFFIPEFVKDLVEKYQIKTTHLVIGLICGGKKYFINFFIRKIIPLNIWWASYWTKYLLKKIKNFKNFSYWIMPLDYCVFCVRRCEGKCTKTPVWSWTKKGPWVAVLSLVADKIVA